MRWLRFLDVEPAANPQEAGQQPLQVEEEEEEAAAAEEEDAEDAVDVEEGEDEEELEEGLRRNDETAAARGGFQEKRCRIRRIRPSYRFLNDENSRSYTTTATTAVSK